MAQASSAGSFLLGFQEGQEKRAAAEPGVGARDDSTSVLFDSAAGNGSEALKQTKQVLRH